MYQKRVNNKHINSRDLDLYFDLDSYCGLASECVGVAGPGGLLLLVVVAGGG